MRTLLITMIMSLIFIASLQSAASCLDLVSELKSMKEAQSTIHESLIANHEIFATTLQSYSEALAESGGKAHKTVSANMLKSADSFHGRGLKAQKTAVKLEEATEDLIQRVSKCLK